MARLDDAAVKQALTSLPGWQQNGIAIERKYEFKNFAQAMMFVNAVAYAAEKADHHPDVDIRYNKVTISLYSHDSGGVTERDVKMAKKVNELAG